MNSGAHHKPLMDLTSTPRVANVVLRSQVEHSRECGSQECPWHVKKNSWINHNMPQWKQRFYDFTVHTTIGNHVLISRNCQPLLEVRPVLAPTIWKQGNKDRQVNLTCMFSLFQKWNLLDFCCGSFVKYHRYSPLEFNDTKHLIIYLQFAIHTLQGTNISPKNGILKMMFLFPRWDMLVPWRVTPFSKRMHFSGVFLVNFHNLVTCFVV